MTDHATTTLTEDQCWEYLAKQPIGRLATAAVGEPEIFPLNYAVSGRNIYVRTVPGTKLVELVVNAKVAFEIDQWSSDVAYSVVVKGRAEIVDSDAEIAEAEATGLVTYGDDAERDVWVRITPSEVTGRRLVR
jgi:nitroimidazol reductase NimA-like FMN-containing flavoprotein (pyridoxamine 5'-phosphate oxidase superfamily)